jgi:stearoyl-CoA desaturase (delta-9 desaturase)
MPALHQAVMFVSVVGPLVGLIAATVLLWRPHAGGIGVGWPEVIVMLAMYGLMGFGVTIGFHRLLTHRAFETPRYVRWALAIFGSAAGQGMLIRWCATHRRHHQVSDRDGDPHSPHLHGDGPLSRLRGMFHAHVGWCFDADRPDLARSVADLLCDPALLLIDQLYFVWIALGLVVPGAILGAYYNSWHGFVSGVIWGGLVRICLMQHVTWSINSVCHVWGKRPFPTADYSTNNFPIAVLSLGEGWHNNHHAFPSSARHGLHWWQFDASYVVIRWMGWLSLAWDIRVPDAPAMAAKLRSRRRQNGTGPII